MTRGEFEETCRDICPQCKAGIAIRQREDTKEMVHDSYRGNAISHSFCLASNFRNKYKDSLGGE